MIAQSAAPLIGTDPALSQPERRTPGQALAQRLGTAFSQTNDNLDLIVDHVEDVSVARRLIQLSGALDEGHRLLFSCYSTEVRGSGWPGAWRVRAA